MVSLCLCSGPPPLHFPRPALDSVEYYLHLGPGKGLSSWPDQAGPSLDLYVAHGTGCVSETKGVLHCSGATLLAIANLDDETFLVGQAKPPWREQTLNALQSRSP